MRRTVTVIALVLSLFVSGWVAAAQPVQKPNLPSDVLAVVEIANPKALFDQFGAYVRSVAPDAPVTRGGRWLSPLTKSANADTLDLGRPFRLLAVKAGNGEIDGLKLFSVSDYAQYLAGLVPAWKSAGKEGEISLFYQERRYFDRQGFMKATPEERQVRQSFRKTRKIPLAIGSAGRVVCMGENADAVAKGLQFVKAGQITDKPLLFAGDAAVYAKPKELLDHLTAAPDNPLARFRKRFLKLLSAMPGRPASPSIGVIVEAEFDAAEALAKQIESVQAVINVDAQNIRISYGLDALPGTGLATYLSTVTAGLPATLDYVPEDAFAIGALRVGDTRPLEEWVAGFQRKILSAVGDKPEQVEEVVAAMRRFFEMNAEEATFAMLPGFTFSFIQVVRYKDIKGMADMQRKMMAITREFMRLYQTPGIKMKFDWEPTPLSYRGRDILSGAFTFDVQPPEGADPLHARIAEAQRRAITAMYGETMTYHVTSIGNDWITTTGEGSLDAIKEIIDGKYRKLRDSDAFKQAVADVPSNASAVIYLRLTDIAEMCIAMMRQINPAVGAMLPSATFPQGPGIAAIVTVSGRHAECNMKIPAAEIKALADPFMQRRRAQPLGGP